MIKAILFDMDGVLIDSLEANYLHFNAWVKHFNKSEISFENYQENYWGCHFNDQIKKFFGKVSEEKQKEMLNYYTKISSQFIKKQKLYPGVKNILKNLKKKYKLALVTSTLSKLTENVLNHFSIKKFFDVVIDGEMIKNPKPAPDAVLLACKKLKIKPGEAVYVGDNFQDVKAGKKAGCSTIAITTTSSIEELKDADKIINNLNELIKVIE
jgi:HAD superfamily hydrolase (TIGR01509 family)